MTAKPTASSPAEGERLPAPSPEWKAAAEAFLCRAAPLPELGVEESELLVFAVERLPDGEPPHEALSRMHAADLKLVLACIKRHPDAARRLDETLRRAATQALRRMHPSFALIDDVVQQVQEQLLTSGKLRSYQGTGSLSAWLRVIAYRAALRETQRYASEMPCDSDTFIERLLPADDPELQSVKAAVKQVFRTAFARAVEALSHFDRELLREHVLAGRSVPSLADEHHVHRATVARWVARIRERLLADTREQMALELGVKSDEVDEVIELFDSRLSASVERLLA